METTNEMITPLPMSGVKMLKMLKNANSSMPAASAMFRYRMIGYGSVTKIFLSEEPLLSVLPEVVLFIY